MTAAQQSERYAAAFEYANRALSIQEKQPGAKPLDIGEAYVRCAILLRLANKQTEAEGYEKRAREIYATLPTSPEPMSVRGGVLTGSALLKVQPRYPVEAKQTRAQGPVQVRVTIDEVGIVIEAVPINGRPELHQASVEAARQWRFKPTVVNGVPRKVQSVLTFNFTLQ